MPQGRVVEGEVACCYCVLIANTHSQPVAAVLFDLKSHLARSVALLVEGGLHQTEVIVVTFSRFYYSVAHHCNPCVLELTAELEVDLGLEKIRVLGSLLKDFPKGLNLRSYLGLLDLEIFFNFGLNRCHSLFDV
jgi:hypothetical protein